MRTGAERIVGPRKKKGGSGDERKGKKGSAKHTRLDRREENRFMTFATETSSGSTAAAAATWDRCG